MLGLQHSLMLPHHQVMAIGRSIAQAAVAGAAAADDKGEEDWGIPGHGEGLEVALVVVMLLVVMVISLHKRKGSGELAHVDGRHGTERNNLRSRS